MLTDDRLSEIERDVGTEGEGGRFNRHVRELAAEIRRLWATRPDDSRWVPAGFGAAVRACAALQRWLDGLFPAGEDGQNFVPAVELSVTEMTAAILVHFEGGELLLWEDQNSGPLSVERCKDVLTAHAAALARAFGADPPALAVPPGTKHEDLG